MKLDSDPSSSRKVRREGLTKQHFSRREEIQILTRKLEWDGHPRLQMLFLVMLTGAAGLAVSYGLLHLGVNAMLARYPLSVGGAYVAFLLLLWIWLRTEAKDYVDVGPEIPLPSGGHSGPSGGAHEHVFTGGGGDSGGGGASGSFAMDDSLPSPSIPDMDIAGGKTIGDGVGDALGAADEGAIPIAIVLLIAVVAAFLFFATLYIVYLAPALFAELLVDGILSASLYRRLRGLQTRHWLESAVRRTFLPFAVTALALTATAYMFSLYAPQAHTLGEVVKYFRMPKGM